MAEWKWLRRTGSVASSVTYFSLLLQTVRVTCVPLRWTYVLSPHPPLAMYLADILSLPAQSFLYPNSFPSLFILGFCSYCHSKQQGLLGNHTDTTSPHEHRHRTEWSSVRARQVWQCEHNLRKLWQFSWAVALVAYAETDNVNRPLVDFPSLNIMWMFRALV